MKPKYKRVCPYCGETCEGYVGNSLFCKCGAKYYYTTQTWLERKKPKEKNTSDLVEVVRKPVKGYEGYYEVDQFGRVYSCDRVIPVDDNGRHYNKALGGKQMKQNLHSKGYKVVSLTKDGKTKTVFVHRIVAEAFIPNENNLPMVNHKDEDKTNNFAENLEWCTALYNCTYVKAREKQAKRIRGKRLSEEHKQKISEGVKRSYGERREG